MPSYSYSPLETWPAEWGGLRPLQFRPIACMVLCLQRIMYLIIGLAQSLFRKEKHWSVQGLLGTGRVVQSGRWACAAHCHSWMWLIPHTTWAPGPEQQPRMCWETSKPCNSQMLSSCWLPWAGPEVQSILCSGLAQRVRDGNRTAQGELPYTGIATFYT